MLENRWAAADKIFKDNGIEAVDYFTGADPAEIKKIVSDELAKGDVHGIWMDAGDGAVAAIEAFEDAGVDLPVMTGEDEMSFLRKWEETKLTGLARQRGDARRSLRQVRWRGPARLPAGVAEASDPVMPGWAGR